MPKLYILKEKKYKVYVVSMITYFLATSRGINSKLERMFIHSCVYVKKNINTNVHSAVIFTTRSLLQRQYNEQVKSKGKWIHFRYDIT